jgi:hypothetical protein
MRDCGRVSSCAISQCLLSAQIQVTRWANKRVTFHAYAAILNISSLNPIKNIDSMCQVLSSFKIKLKLIKCYFCL